MRIIGTNKWPWYQRAEEGDWKYFLACIADDHWTWQEFVTKHQREGNLDWFRDFLATTETQIDEALPKVNPRRALREREAVRRVREYVKERLAAPKRTEGDGRTGDVILWIIALVPILAVGAGVVCMAVGMWIQAIAFLLLAIIMFGILST